jgi:hypothetical protein
MIYRFIDYLSSKKISNLSNCLHLIFFSFLKNWSDLVSNSFLAVILNILQCNFMVEFVFLLNCSKNWVIEGFYTISSELSLKNFVDNAKNSREMLLLIIISVFDTYPKRNTFRLFPHLIYKRFKFRVCTFCLKASFSNLRNKLLIIFKICFTFKQIDFGLLTNIAFNRTCWYTSLLHNLIIFGHILKSKVWLK